MTSDRETDKGTSRTYAEAAANAEAFDEGTSGGDARTVPALTPCWKGR